MNVDELLSQTRDAITVSRVFGEPIEEDGVTVVPVAAVRGGGGGGGDDEDNGGGGFGVSARPVGVYVIEGGEVSWRPAVDPMRLALGGQLVGALAIAAAWSVGRAWLRARPRARSGRGARRALVRLARRRG
jgi:Sporulation protein YtfJ (Spore_YtfJ)